MQTDNINPDNIEPLQLFTVEQQKDIKRKGRPRVIKTANELWQCFCDYIEWNNEQAVNYCKTDFIKAGQQAGRLIDVPQIPMLQIETFCDFIGVTDETLLNYAKRQGNEDLFGIVTRIKAKIADDQIKRASLDLVNPNIVAMINNMKQRQDVTTNDNELPIASITFQSKPIE